jgi:hypothetical protein
MQTRTTNTALALFQKKIQLWQVILTEEINDIAMQPK